MKLSLVQKALDDHGKLSEKTRKEIGTVGSSKREGMAASEFLNEGEKKYPWKIGDKPSKKLLEAACREAQMHGDSAILSKAKKLLKEHFGVEWGGK